MFNAWERQNIGGIRTVCTYEVCQSCQQRKPILRCASLAVFVCVYAICCHRPWWWQVRDTDDVNSYWDYRMPCTRRCTTIDMVNYDFCCSFLFTSPLIRSIFDFNPVLSSIILSCCQLSDKQLMNYLWTDDFYPCDAVLAYIMCPSVRVSHTGIVPKR